MERSLEFRGNRIDVEEPVKTPVVANTFRAGYDRQTECSFDSEGNLVSRIRTVVRPAKKLADYLVRNIFGINETMEVDTECPFFAVCKECPKRGSVEQDHLAADAEVLVRAAQVDDVISGVRQF